MGLSPTSATTFTGCCDAFPFFGLSFLILILIMLLIRTLEGDEIKIRIRSKIKRGTQKSEMHPASACQPAPGPKRNFRNVVSNFSIRRRVSCI